MHRQNTETHLQHPPKTRDKVATQSNIVVREEMKNEKTSPVQHDFTTYAKRGLRKLGKRKEKKNSFDHRRGRTCNLLIRSQTRCHFARRPLYRCETTWPIIQLCVYKIISTVHPVEIIHGASHLRSVSERQSHAKTAQNWPANLSRLFLLCLRDRGAQHYYGSQSIQAGRSSRHRCFWWKRFLSSRCSFPLQCCSYVLRRFNCPGVCDENPQRTKRLRTRTLLAFHR